MYLVKLKLNIVCNHIRSPETINSVKAIAMVTIVISNTRLAELQLNRALLAV